ncbi:MAG: FGGY-family carbohydrate kinase [Candidatus Promineifilaceae bacterium]|jgi:sugar (pentulose or hexulose) kinase
MINAILGLDVGTTTTKAVLFDLAGRELARSNSEPYSNLTPHTGWVEQDPERLWRAVVSTIRHVVEQAGVGVHVQAVGMAAQSGSLLPADGDGKPVYPLITWMDGRTKNLVKQWLIEGAEEQVRALSGWSLYPGLCLPTIAWLRENDHETFTAAHHYFSVNDFIAYRLSGHFVMNPSNGGGMQLVDIHTGTWSDALLQLAGISSAQLSPIRPSGTVIGEISREVCHETKLPEGTVLVNGGHDQVCTALALGVNDPGKLLLACGTAWVITGVADTKDLERVPPSLDLNFHAQDGRYTISQSLGGLGASLEWWVHQAWRGSGDSPSREALFVAMDTEVTAAQADSSIYFLPLTGGHDNPATTQYGSFQGLQLNQNRADLARAIMESAAFELRWALEPIKEAGLPLVELWMVGGAAKSATWPSILANITAIPIRLPQYDNWPALGGAILAGVGMGELSSIEDGLSRFRKPAAEVVPDRALNERYDDRYQTYKTLRSERT